VNYGAQKARQPNRIGDPSAVPERFTQTTRRRRNIRSARPVVHFPGRPGLSAPEPGRDPRGPTGFPLKKLPSGGCYRTATALFHRFEGSTVVYNAPRSSATGKRPSVSSFRTSVAPHQIRGDRVLKIVAIAGPSAPWRFLGVLTPTCMFVQGFDAGPPDRLSSCHRRRDKSHLTSFARSGLDYDTRARQRLAFTAETHLPCAPRESGVSGFPTARRRYEPASRKGLPAPRAGWFTPSETRRFGNTGGLIMRYVKMAAICSNVVRPTSPRRFARIPPRQLDALQPRYGRAKLGTSPEGRSRRV